MRDIALPLWFCLSNNKEILIIYIFFYNQNIHQMLSWAKLLGYDSGILLTIIIINSEWEDYMMYGQAGTDFCLSAVSLDLLSTAAPIFTYMDASLLLWYLIASLFYLSFGPFLQPYLSSSFSQSASLCCFSVLLNAQIQA